MEYKTTIEVVTDAENEHEAADIAGEFLTGHLTTGADLKVKTMSVATARKVNVALAICLTSSIVSAFVVGNKLYSYKMGKSETKPVTAYAIQPPLRTNPSDIQSKEFKDAWEKAQKDKLDSLAR